jgi:hypothetical protein
MSTIKKGYFPNYSVDKFILYQTFENRLVFWNRLQCEVHQPTVN